MKSRGWLLLVITMIISAAADDKNTTISKSRKVRRGDNLIPRILSELTFALNFEIQQNNPTTNIIFSPLSITSVLGMIMLGARGKTYKEISNTLLGHMPGNLDKNVGTMHRKLKYLIERLEQQPKSKPGVHLAIANAVFIQKDIKIHDAFSRSIQNIYNSNVVMVDFLNDPEDAKTVINNWVDKHTNSCIKELFSSPPDINTHLVLANAIYFVGEWEYPFDSKETKTNTFHAVNGDIDIPMMQREGGSYYYFESSELNCSILGMSYKGKHATMYFILPEKNLTDFVTDISSDTIMFLKEKAYSNEKQVIITIPKMTLQSTINLQEPLANMGMKTLFGSGANLRGISEEVFVNDAVHKVNIEVSEFGTIAAAVTAFSMTRMRHPIFILNRPFLFFIYHEKAKIPLFWGTVGNPSA